MYHAGLKCHKDVHRKLVRDMFGTFSEPSFFDLKFRLLDPLSEYVKRVGTLHLLEGCSFECYKAHIKSAYRFPSRCQLLGMADSVKEMETWNPPERDWVTKCSV